MSSIPSRDQKQNPLPEIKKWVFNRMNYVSGEPGRIALESVARGGLGLRGDRIELKELLHGAG